MTFLELNHVALHVADLERSCKFYEKALRLQKIKRPNFNFPGAWYRFGAHQELHLIAGREDPVQFKDRGTHYALMVDDMDAWEAFFRENQVAYHPRRTRPDGAFQIYVTDPDGYVIELCTAIPNSL